MKKIDIIKTGLLLLLAVAFVAGCNEKEYPFVGNDNYIATFTLTKDGVTLKGDVSPEAIVIAAPERFSLSGATASVTVSENATITPNPATITDWDEAHTFTVTAYTGTKKTYAYRVERSLVSRDGDVVLLTQADVDAFAEEAKDADQINGSLTIGAATGQDSIYSLAGLEALKIISGDVVINATYAGENLVAFENLEKTNELRIASKKVETIRFPKLAAVHSDLNIDQATAVKTLDFPELTIADKALRIYYVDSLASMNFSKLQQVVGNVTIQGRSSGAQNLQTIDFPALQKVSGTFTLSYWREVTTVNFPELSNVTGTFTVSNLAKLEQFVTPKLETTGSAFVINYCSELLIVHFPVLKTVNGSLTVSSATALTAMQFPSLESVTGSLTIPNAADLTTLQFPALKYIGNELSVNLQSLVSLDAFSTLDSIGGRLFLYNLTNLTSLGLSSIKKIDILYAYGLTNITEIDVRGVNVGTLSLYGATMTGLTIIGDDEFAGKLYIGTPPSGVTNFPVTIQGFKKVGELEISIGTYISAIDFLWIEEVAGLLNFSSGSAVKTINLPNLKSAGGIQINYYNALETFNLPILEKIAGYTNASGAVAGNFTYGVSSNIVSLTLPKLQSVVGNISITGLTATRKLETISFPELDSLTGTLTITGTNNPAFTDLSGFSNLTSAGGVTISYFTQLKDFEPLKNVLPSLDAVVWKITNCGYNPTYKDMLAGKYSN
jgi:hypothetical protein